MTIDEDANHVSASLSPVDPVALAPLFAAHTVYHFAPDPVPADTIERLYDLVKFAPTAFNAQPLRLVVVEGPSKERLLPYLFETNKEKTASAPLTFIAAADTDFHDHFADVMPHAPGLRNLFLDDAYRTTVATNNAWLQLGYLILGARSLGLGVGPMSGVDIEGVTADLLVGTSLRAIAAVNVGSPADRDDAVRPRNPRLSPDVVIQRL